jgi:hypothetical protein
MHGRPAVVAFRVISAIGGGYLFAWGCTALGALLLAKAGMARSESVVLASMLAYLVYLAAALCAATARRPWTAGVALLGGGAALAACAHALGRIAT